MTMQKSQKMTKEITIAGVEIPSRFFLAPMAGYTDSIFRSICRDFGAGLLVTELVSATALARKIKKTYRYMEHRKEDYPTSLQLFGHIEDDYKTAITKNDLSSYAFIDINMGCPTKKIVRSGSGAYLTTDTKKMCSILSAVKSVTNIPVSVKTRLGYKRGNDDINATIDRIASLIELKPAFITLHGRYASDMYSGTADWEAIAQVKEAIGDNILIGNGDIKNMSDAKRAFEISGVDGIMVGRAAVGAPWLFNELNSLLDDRVIYSKPDNSVIRETMIRHLNGAVKLYGEVSGVHFMRKFIMKYLGEMGIDKRDKIEFMKCDKIEEFQCLLDKKIN